MKRIVALMLVVILALSLCACGGEPDPREGRYIAQTIENSGFTFDVEDEWVEIKGGKMTIRLQGEEYPGKYRFEDEKKIYLIVGSEEFRGMIDGEYLYVDLGGLFYTYIKES